MREAEALQALIDESRHIVFFGGAGVSTESGIPDFRSVDGLYRQRWKYPPETMIGHRFFVHNTAEFFEFYRTKMLCLDAKPNAAHKKLAEMEGAGRLDAVITQNIDGLHQAAGSKVVYELHGSVHRNHCTACGKFYDAHFIKECTGVPRCTCGGLVKPDVVLYEEPLDSDTVGRAVRALERTDLLIIAGTSLAVYPAAGLIDYCRGKIVLINRSATPMDSRADLLIAGSVGEVMARIRV
ncbi:NAD-dependent protein deacylase [Anaerotruncus rubiinfantis]|jgi:NAD-dependent deacetylase|uniref:NAD-dependent protein deacylase n=1 Tax=Anaerotruncus rubiinfantis TaxID=1720200 RepID=UPI00082C2A3E|nr:NAD-dependent protein deacylase [Anaerotruncus rubiinfantis]